MDVYSRDKITTFTNEVNKLQPENYKIKEATLSLPERSKPDKFRT